VCLCGILDSGDVEEEGGDGETIEDLHDGSGRGGHLHCPKRRGSSNFKNWASRLRAMASFLSRVLGQCRVCCLPKKFLTLMLVPM
jgi:hypothetical protein